MVRLFAGIALLVLAPVAHASGEESGAPDVVPPAVAAPAVDPAPLDPARLRCTPDGLRCIGLDTYFNDVCATIETAADETGLDAAFLARLLWKESLFDAAAISPKGALGIAQFMPGTAQLRGLDDPLNPAAAIFASAAYLAELTERFGNPGLAAVAYNGGEARAERFLAVENTLLPGETLDYVTSITGHSARAWRDAPPEAPDWRLDPKLPFHDACLAQAEGRRIRDFADPVPPWGVVVASSTRRGAAESMAGRLRRAKPSFFAGTSFRMVRASVPGVGNSLRWTAQVPAGSRREAMNFCLRLRTTGAICRIHRN